LDFYNNDLSLGSGSGNVFDCPYFHTGERLMAKPHKKRVKVKKLKHNLKDKHTNNKIKGRGYDDPAEMNITNTKKTKKQKQDNKKQQIKKVDIKKDTKKRKK
jgi:hypothetical protein